MIKICVCVYLRLCIDVGVVGDELFDHVRLSSERCDVEGCVSFLLSNGEKETNKYYIFNLNINSKAPR